MGNPLCDNYLLKIVVTIFNLPPHTFLLPPHIFILSHSFFLPQDLVRITTDYLPTKINRLPPIFLPQI